MAEKWERWTTPEVVILKKHYPNTPRDELLRDLPGRTWNSIGHAAEKHKIRRNWRDIPLNEDEAAAILSQMTLARASRTAPPFAGNRHTAEAKLAISVSNLHARGHCIAAIADRNGIAEKEVKRILKERVSKRRNTRAYVFKRGWGLK